jgi:hypothetical protein
LALIVSAAFIALLLQQMASHVKPVQAQSVPLNIILIITDDQRWDSLAYMPHLQSEFVAQG